MGYVLASTVYDAGTNFAWQNAHDRVSYQRAFEQGSTQDRKVAQALISANVTTPNIEIRVNMSQPPVVELDHPVNIPPTIDDILANDINFNAKHLNDSAATDFSGSNGSYGATERPYVPATGTW